MSQPKAINLQDLPQAKLKDLLEFPCHFTFKVVGANREDLVDDVVVVTQKICQRRLQSTSAKKLKRYL